MDKQKINDVLSHFKIKADCLSVRQHRHFIFANLQLQPGQLKKINANLIEIGLHLKSFLTPILKVKSKDGVVQLQLVVSQPDKLSFNDLISVANPPNVNNFILGETIDGDIFSLNLNNDPHLLIAGTTGSGKSNLLHNIITNALLCSDIEIVLIDPKKIEFQKYSDKKKITAVINNYEESCKMMDYLVQVMEQRYDLLSKFNKIKFPSIIVVIDELADLIYQDKNKQFETTMVRLAAKARACGIHLIVATQRPSVNVVTGLIKANFPARLACRVVSRIDSQIILDEPGAENLLGKGDSFFKSGSTDLTRLQIALIE